MRTFWNLIRSGDYEQIGPTIEGLKAVLENEPEDVEAHKAIAFLRSWQLGEMYRSETLDLSVAVGGLQEATHHFSVALEAEDDPRLVIFKSTNEYMAAKQLNNQQMEQETKSAF